MQQTGATADHKPLDVFSGKWQTSGEVLGRPPGSTSTFHGSDTFEWLPGGFFMVHRWDVDMPDGKSEGIEIIGFDATHSGYSIFSFDNQGSATLMKGSTQDGRWTFTGDLMRFTGALDDDGNVVSGKWEMRSDPNSPWEPWMNVTLKKAG